MAARFQAWLNGQLRALNTDESIFGSYILGILEGEETQDEKMEALEGILSETGAPNLAELVSTIYNKWLDCQPQSDATTKKEHHEIDVNAQLAKLLEKQTIQPAAKEREYTEEERRIKAQILAQYSETPISDEEDGVSDHEDVAGAGAASTGASGFAPNTNKADVMALQKERREQARQDSAAKKQKDKDDREKQKQLREEKKEKRKTVKGERRR